MTISLMLPTYLVGFNGLYLTGSGYFLIMVYSNMLIKINYRHFSMTKKTRNFNLRRVCSVFYGVFSR